MAKNGISTLSTKEAKMHAKLNLAELKRKGYTLDTSGNVVSGPDITKPFYRARNQYDITELPTQYVVNTSVDNPNPDGLIYGRPWHVQFASEEILLEDGTDIYQEDGSSLFLTE
jgi:hypothetical protein